MAPPYLTSVLVHLVRMILREIDPRMQVYMPFCSKDQWSGQMTTGQFPGASALTEDTSGPIYFAGHLIVKAVVAQLQVS